MTDINQLQSQNLNEFSCPCSKITIPFGTFTLLNFTFHQVNIVENIPKIYFFRFVQVILYRRNG